MASACAGDSASPYDAEVWNETAVAEVESVAVAAGCVAARNEPLARHTSMGVGGPTPLMLWPRHPEAVGVLLEWCAVRQLSWRVLSGGTNVLAADRGVDNIVLNLTRLTDGAHIVAPTAVFPAGMPTAQALRLCLGKGLAGLVWSSGLPGTIGGAAAGNAGCWGGQMADVVERLEIIDSAGRHRVIEGDELGWDYRRLTLPSSLGEGAVIVSISVSLRPQDPETLQQRSDELHAAKRRRQPVGARNAGCVFKNPDQDHPAGLLIDRAGCKGMRVGDVQVSEVHGNFLVNHGNATAADVEELISRIKTAVREQAGTVLTEEIHRW